MASRTVCALIVIPRSRSEIHGVEHLITHVPLADGAGQLEESIGQGRLAMVDVGNDGEVAMRD